MLTANDIARYFLALCDVDEGDLMTHLKLQKLVYYAQGFSLAINDKPLFDDPIEAWAHGPVIPNLYRIYADYRSDPIPTPNDLDLSMYDIETRKLLDEVYAVYGQYTASRLRNMTHTEPPWRLARERGDSEIISLESMKAFFDTLVE
jgi:uncharacterized phage-associated protein